MWQGPGTTTPRARARAHLGVCHLCLGGVGHLVQLLLRVLVGHMPEAAPHAQPHRLVVTEHQLGARIIHLG